MLAANATVPPAAAAAAAAAAFTSPITTSDYAYDEQNSTFEHTLSLPLPFVFGRENTSKKCRRVVVKSVQDKANVSPAVVVGDVIYKVGRLITVPMNADEVLQELQTTCTNARSTGVTITFWRPPPARMETRPLRHALVHLPAIIKWRNTTRKYKGKKAAARPPLKTDESGCFPMQGHLSMKSGLGYATGRRYFKLLNGKLNFANTVKEIDDSNKLRGSVNLYQVSSVLRVKTEIELKFSAEAHEKPLKLKANSTEKGKCWFSAIKERCDWLRT